MRNTLTVERSIKLLKLAGVEVTTTINILRAINGTYAIDYGIPAVYSPNALFGKFLRNNSASIGITYQGTKRVKLGTNWTTTAIWRLE